MHWMTEDAFWFQLPLTSDWLIQNLSSFNPSGFSHSNLHNSATDYVDASKLGCKQANHYPQSLRIDEVLF